MRSALLLTVAGILFGPCVSPRAAGQSPLLENTLAAHRNHRESITTFRGHVKFAQTIVKKPTFDDQFEGDFWISPTAMRIKYVEQGETWDTLVSHSVRTNVIARPGSEVSGTRLSMPRKHFHRCDPYILGLLVINIPGNIKYCYLEDLAANARRAPSAAREQSGGLALVRLEYDFDFRKDKSGEWRTTIWLDPQKNYLISKMKYEGNIDGKKIERVVEIVAFSEVAPGILFPTEMSGIASYDGVRGDNWKGSLSAVRVNEPLLDSAFTQTFPNGMLMVDGIRDANYRVDSIGQPLGPEVSTAGSNPPPPEPARTPNIERLGSSSEEPSPWGNVAIAMGALIIAGLAGIAYRRLRSRADSAS